METTETVYKIRRLSDGYYSKGGHFPLFSKKGKIWKRSSDLHLHLKALGNKDAYAECVIDEYQITVQQVNAKPASTWIAEVMESAKEKDKEKRKRQKSERLFQISRSMVQLENEYKRLYNEPV